MPTPRARVGELDDERGRPTTLREWAHLYAAADEFTVRAQTGEAAKVLVEVREPLAEAERAGVGDLVIRLRFVVALGNLQLGQFDEAIDACSDVLEGGDEALDPAWMSSIRTLRSIAYLFRGDNGLAVTDLINAAVDLDDAPPLGQNFVFAVNGLGVGYKTLRLYELALEEYQRADELIRRPGYNVSRVFHVMNQILIESYWGLEIDRMGRADEAARHFDRALEIASDVHPLPPSMRTKAWDLRLAARLGLCRAMLGQYEAAIEELEPTVETMARMGLDEEAMARIGLVRAYGDRGDHDRAHLESERAVTAADKIKDVQLVIAAGWERLRNAAAAQASRGASIGMEFAQQLESVRWDERERFVRETRDRLDSERERRAARKISVEYLTDPVTGLANRRHLEGRLPEMVARARTNDETVSLAFVELDPGLPQEGLVDAGQRLRDAATTDGFIARWDGAEFVLVVPRQTAVGLANSVRRALSDLYEPGDPRALVNGDSRGDGRGDGAADLEAATVRPRVPATSVGVAAWRRNVTVPGLVMAADEALLAARRSGGGIRIASDRGAPRPTPGKPRTTDSAPKRAPSTLRSVP